VGPRSARHEELYVVLSVHATFTVDGEEVDAPTGTLVFVGDPAAKRKAVAVEPETAVLAVGAPAGEAFTPSEWERSAPALGYFATGEYDKAYELLAKAHEEFPDDAHLEQSIAADNVFVELAQKDTDFDPIRDDPRFASLVG
jgi:hypothetical protein